VSTGHPGWVCLGGTEIVNQQRVFTYAQSGGCGTATIRDCDSCGPEMAVALEQPGGVYVDPVTDDAPWYAPNEPHSPDFSGLFVTSITGLGPGPITRTVSPRASGRGSFFGPENMGSPIIEVTGLLLGKTPCAVAYGFRWLTMALRGSPCIQGGCGGDDLTYLDCCPDWTADPVADIEPHLRTLKGVKLLSSPRITARLGQSCSCHDSGGLLQVTFQLGASEPCVFRDPVPVIEDTTFDLETATCVTWLPIGPNDTCPVDTSCDGPTDCLTDPDCAAPPLPPVAPPPKNPCICRPLSTVKACASFDSSIIPEFAEGVPVVTINAGSQPLRQVSMVFIANPFNQPVEDLDPCTACGEVTLSRIPAGASFVMDGTTRTVTIDCPGSGPTDATSLLGSGGGQLPFRFPEIPCGGSGYAVCVTADASSVAPDASFSVDIVVREC
jgi:hypothetical protein